MVFLIEVTKIPRIGSGATLALDLFLWDRVKAAHSNTEHGVAFISYRHPFVGGIVSISKGHVLE